jgi:hypothetical protein
MVSLEFSTDLDRNCRIHRQQAVDEFLEKCRHWQSRHSAEQAAIFIEIIAPTRMTIKLDMVTRLTEQKTESVMERLPLSYLEKGDCERGLAFCGFTHYNEHILTSWSYI